MRSLSNVISEGTVYSLCQIDSKLSVVYMQIVLDKPPNYAAIVERFPFVAAAKGVYFCWGDRIFNPDGVPIPEAILTHEQVHSVRQGGQPERWWASYLESAEFRLNEELPAHVAEYWWWRDRVKDRNKLAAHLAQIAGRLASPLYGSLIPLGDAMRKIRTWR